MDTLSSHSSYLLQQLQEQRIQGMLCDCMLVVKGVCFKAHKNVLAAFSSYFRSLFQNSPSQKNEVFNLVIQDVSGIGQILDYMYTSRLDINQDNVQALLDIAQCLQVPNVQSMCNTFLKPCPPVHDCLLGIHGYKLRNFYSKQYFKQSAIQASNQDALLSLPVRPKKTVYLKKYNYLRSQKALEEMFAKSVSEPILNCPKDTHSEDSVVRIGAQGSPVENPATVREDAPKMPSDAEIPRPPPTNQEEQGLQTLPEPPQQTGHKYSCNMCGKIFKHPSNLEMHKRSHTGEKPFECNVCGKNFSQAGNLQTHLRRHSGEKPYICELCGKSFTASGDVHRHKVVHTGEKPHLCDICGRGFNNLSNLKEHKRTHATDKTFTCDQCGKSFNTHRKLLKHKACHGGEKPHSCDTCGKCFIGSGDLQRHIRSHTGEKPYLCNTCGKSFTRSAMLRKHSNMRCKGAPTDGPSPPGSVCVACIEWREETGTMAEMWSDSQCCQNALHLP
uniref:Zinc finger and BTB domain containing 49 n=1 Tax=Hippocampus comes TaxID=109280 RepID=A0A3Q3DZL3_HIPCM